MSNMQFITKEQHFQAILDTLDPMKRVAWEGMRHIRPETMFRGRRLRVYRMDGDEPVVLEDLIVEDFHCDDAEGASTRLRSLTNDREIVVGYQPTLLWEHPIFVFLPLAVRARWVARDGDMSKPQLSFDMVIRTASRKSLRERNTLFLETLPAWEAEFLNHACEA